MTTPLHILRQAMRTHQIDAYIVPTADAHLSEYLPAHWQAREWLSGFTGSAGTLLVTADFAALWTDSRYWEQAEQQLANQNILLKKQGIDPDLLDDLVNNMAAGSRIAVPADMLSWAMQKRFQAAFARQNLILDTEIDLLSDIWQTRPALPHAPVFRHAAECVCESSSQKLDRIRQFMQTQNADFHLISSLDDIAWITNLRGNDIPYNPVFLSHLLISPNQATLFVNEKQLDNTVRDALAQAGIGLANYDAIAPTLATLSGCLLLDANKIAASTLSQLNQNVKLIEHINPSSLFKSQKSPAEIAHIRQAMREDGAALCQFFAHLETDLANGISLTELDIDHRLSHYRSQRAGYLSPSFGTIAAFQENGAQAHYSATESSHKSLTGNGLLLIDSGAQYHNGTTDITRVMAIGEVSEMAKRDYTLVLKAHIALAQAVFPDKISAACVDAICRAPLWQHQRDYGHGTGHGVGYCLNVHEFPASISYRATANPHNILQVGQMISNEPALYRSGEYGIRIENLVVCQHIRQPETSEFGEFLCFETLTLCPIDTRLILIALLSESERAWLNDYHAKVREQLSPLLANDTAAQAWLLARSQAI